MKIKTEAEQKAEMANCIAWAGIWLMMLYALTACSVKMEVGWHGETAKDDKTYTDGAVKK